MKKLFSLMTALIFLSPTQSAQDKKFSEAFLSLVEAERAFARTSVEIGVRDSFIKFFADDGINFTPHPTKTREELSKRPATKSPLVLDWAPVFADIAQSGEFGYTTGPYTMKDTRPQPAPTRHGFYFSIWKRQADGAWKVVLDLGIKTPEPREKYQLTAAPKGRINKALITPDLAPVRDELLALDRKFFDVAKSAGTGKAFFAFVRDDVRIHRDGRLPMTGTKSLRAYFNEKPFEMTGSPITSDVAQSADLGYTYGNYELKWAGGQKPEKGYYVRIWKRAPDGKWQIALDTITAVPEN